MPHPLPQVPLQLTCSESLLDMSLLALAQNICPLRQHMNLQHNSKHQSRFSNRPQLSLKIRQEMHCLHL